MHRISPLLLWVGATAGDLHEEHYLTLALSTAISGIGDASMAQSIRIQNPIPWQGALPPMGRVEAEAQL